MKALYVTIALFAATSAFAGQDRLESFLGKERVSQFGGEKLSQKERDSLAAYILSYASEARLGNSAVTYLEGEGWRRIKILGTVERDYDTFLVIQDRFRKFAVKKPILGMFPTGEYLAEMGLRDIRNMIDANGSGVSFLLVETIDLD